jgi:hypothetical protein
MLRRDGAAAAVKFHGPPPETRLPAGILKHYRGSCATDVLPFGEHEYAKSKAKVGHRVGLAGGRAPGDAIAAAPSRPLARQGWGREFESLRRRPFLLMFQGEKDPNGEIRGDAGLIARRLA